MKKLFLALAVVVGLVGCATVSQADYDAVNKQLEQLQAEKVDQSVRYKEESVVMKAALTEWATGFAAFLTERTGKTVTIAVQEVYFIDDYAGAVARALFTGGGMAPAKSYNLFVKTSEGWKYVNSVWMPVPTEGTDG